MSKQKLAEYENKERSLATQFIYSFSDKIKQAKFTPPNSYSTWDMWYSTWNEPDASIIGEVKVRSFEYTKYPDYILQVDKLKNLIKQMKLGHKIQYLNFFLNQDGYYDLIVFNLTKRVEQWKKDGHIPTQIKRMAAATFKSKYERVDKEVVMLQFDPSIDTLITKTQWK